MINSLFFEELGGSQRVILDLSGASKEEVFVTAKEGVLEVKIKDTVWKGWIPSKLDANSIQTEIKKYTLEIQIYESKRI